MKVTKKQLRRIIREELKRSRPLNEFESSWDKYRKGKKKANIKVYTEDIAKFLKKLPPGLTARQLKGQGSYGSFAMKVSGPKDQLDAWHAEWDGSEDPRWYNDKL